MTIITALYPRKSTTNTAVIRSITTNVLPFWVHYCLTCVRNKIAQSPRESPGTLSNNDGSVNNDGSEKSHFWFTLYFFVRVISVLFLCFNDLVFLHDAKKILRKLFLLRPRSHATLKKIFSRCNFSDNYVQVSSSMHTNVQLLYLIYYCSLPSPSSLLKVPTI